MITVDYVRTLSAYNAKMNDRVFAASDRLGEVARRLDRGAFWRSIHGTLSHILWADCQWMSRFAGWTAPVRALSESDREHDDFGAMREARSNVDQRLSAWAAALDPEWLLADQQWFSGAAQRTMNAPRTLLLAHLFNHQTHHRGQVHAMLTAAGETTGATDLPFVLTGA